MIPNPQQYHMTRLRRVPSAAHSPSDLRVRLGAGTPNARLLHRHVLTRRQRDDLNHNVFTSSARPPGVCGGSAPASRSFVLAALRALHLDPGPRPHRPKPGRGRGQTTEKQQKRQRTPTFTGVPITDKETAMPRGKGIYDDEGADEPKGGRSGPTTASSLLNPVGRHPTFG